MSAADIRSAGQQDIPAIRDIALRTWPVAYRDILSPDQLAYMLERMYSAEALQEQMTAMGHHFLLAATDIGAVGFASFEHSHRSRMHTRLHKLYVVPETQGSGAGKALLEAVVAAARAQDDTSVELNVNRFNPALHFYLRMGFRVVRDQVIDIGQGYVMDDHVLQLDL